MAKRREINVFNIAFLDLLSGALGAVIILYIAVPKTTDKEIIKEKKPTPVVQEIDPEVDSRKLMRTNIKMEEKLKQITKMLNQSQEKVKELEKTNRSLATKTEKIEKELKASSGGIDADVGFKFKGKRVVFIIDVSGSMYREDRIGQVKAGLKMLITSMGKEFSIDVVSYPHGMYASYRPLWSRIRPMTKENKMQIYSFLHGLKPFGSTPTRDVMKFALQNYGDATDIVLLSDGAPTKINSKERDDIGSVLNDIQGRNNRNIQINSIGVGSDFLTNTKNDKYQFLKRLSEMHAGFFVGF
jgi:hypothetical protein